MDPGGRGRNSDPGETSRAGGPRQSTARTAGHARRGGRLCEYAGGARRRGGGGLGLGHHHAEPGRAPRGHRHPTTRATTGGGTKLRGMDHSRRPGRDRLGRGGRRDMGSLAPGTRGSTGRQRGRGRSGSGSGRTLAGKKVPTQRAGGVLPRLSLTHGDGRATTHGTVAGTHGVATPWHTNAARGHGPPRGSRRA